MSGAAQTSAYRVQKDLKEVAGTAVQVGDSPPIFAAPVEETLDHLHAIVVGPSDSPYQFGFFLFDVRFPTAYPNEPPRVRILTNDSGKVRLNPNLYADGKVCLSILGTWRGETEEIWRSSYSLAYVLQCIQCVIMNGEPFFNEPGFERDVLLLRGPGMAPAPAPPVAAATGGASAPTASSSTSSPEPSGSPTSPTAPGALPVRVPWTRERVDEENKRYSEKIRHEVLRIAVCDVLESLLTVPSAAAQLAVDGRPVMPVAPPARILKTFSGEIKFYFTLRFDDYLASCRSQHPSSEDTAAFTRTAFEGRMNGCDGIFNWVGLHRRLNKIFEALNAERDAMRVAGAAETARGTYAAGVMIEEANTLTSEFAGDVTGGPVNAANAFYWRVTFLPSQGPLEGSCYTADIVFDPLGEEPPRVRLLQPIFHPNVTPRGIPCFHAFPPVAATKRWRPTVVVGQIRSLLNGTCSRPEALVHHEASRLCFSREPNDQRAYRRQARELGQSTFDSPVPPPSE